MGSLKITSEPCSMGEAWLSALIESSEDAVISKSLKGVIRSWNRSAERIFGWTADEAIGQFATLLIPPERQQEEAIILAKLAAGERIQHYETERVRKDGRRISVSLSISPIRDSAGTIIGAAKIARDITQRVADDARFAQVNQELEHLSRLHTADQLATGLAHELTQPFGTILNHTIGLQDDLQSGKLRVEDTLAPLTAIAEQARRGGDIIRRLRAFARKRDVAETLLDVSQLLNEAVALLQHELRSDGITVQWQLDADLPQITADSIRISQVMVNLIRNARDAMQAPGAVGRTLTIKTRVTSGMLEIAFADQGCGLSEDRKGTLFEPFSTTKPDGLGMGLAICISILSQSRGALRAEPNPGGGTIFLMAFPTGTEENSRENDDRGFNSVFDRRRHGTPPVLLAAV